MIPVTLPAIGATVVIEGITYRQTATGLEIVLLPVAPTAAAPGSGQSLVNAIQADPVALQNLTTAIASEISNNISFGTNGGTP